MAQFKPKLHEEEELFPDFYTPSIDIIKEVNDTQKTPSERLKLLADAFEAAQVARAFCPRNMNEDILHLEELDSDVKLYLL